ncbi:MAG: Nif3-like dinuclear metal center hexameric protein [Phycisphaerales bacterium]|nr:MAG: Nif3-like dinuclear metal center hexameric protein [Phycisphaerales bacterium]
MKAKDIALKIDQMYPLGLAQDWDNVGLLVGDPQKAVRDILLTIDVTNDVVAEARRLNIDLILSYHPVIWDGLKKITAEWPTRVVYELVRSGIAVFSIHTALDAAIGGVNDGLAEIVGIVEGKPIGDYVQSPAGDNYKLVVFVPAESLAAVSNAVFAAGAGAIGNYSHCGFGAQGTGTFLPQEGAKPAIGRKGRLQKVAEIRFEAIVPEQSLADVIAAMKKAHPYETPAFDIFKLYDPQTPFGLGRIGDLGRPMRLARILERVKDVTGAKALGVIGQENRLVRRAAVCAGSCGPIINSVIAAGADLYVTGELKHHQALAAQEAGLTCICLSHTVSERFILKKIAKQLQKQLKGIKIRASKKDADPFKWKNV